MPLPNAAQKILNVVAHQKVLFNEGLEVSQISSMTGIAGASTIRNGLSALKKEKLLYVESKVAHATPKGMDQADLTGLDDLPKTNSDHQESIKGKLKPKAVELFEALSDGKVHDKEELRESLGHKKNSTWRNLCAALVKEKIAEYPTQNEMQLTKQMFPFQPRPE